MDVLFESAYQAIGEEAESVAGMQKGKIVVYSEVEEGCTACAVFVGVGSQVIYRECSDALDDAVYDLWRRWRETPGRSEWRAISCIIDGGRIDVSFTYPDQISDDEGIDLRRPSVLLKHFGHVDVDYSGG